MILKKLHRNAICFDLPYVEEEKLMYIMSACSDEDRKWFMEAMKAQTIDVVKRMKEISAVMQTPQEVLEAQGVTVEEMEGNSFIYLFIFY